jgi:hypothetical protein
VYRDTILLALFVLVMLIIWIALNVNIFVRKKKMKAIRGQNKSLGNYVTFVHNFKHGEEEEKKGNTKIALMYYNKALEILENEEEKDELVQETIEEVKEKIASLEA